MEKPKEKEGEAQLRCGFACLVGRPNVGKSTLLNHLVGQKVAITSPKPQTTRHRIRGILTVEGSGQAIFLDTPGLHRPKTRLGRTMMEAATGSLSDADVVLWLIEPKDQVRELEEKLLTTLRKSQAPVILVVNKLDSLKNPNEVLRTIDRWKEVYDFHAIVPVSAKTGSNVDELLSVLFSCLPEGPYLYDEADFTDQTERQLAAEFVREKALQALDQEIPHGLAVTIERLEEKKNLVVVEACIICERDSHKGIVIGKGGQMLKKIGTNARYELEQMFDKQVDLKLFVKVRSGWKDDGYRLRELGLEEKP